MFNFGNAVNEPEKHLPEGAVAYFYNGDDASFQTIAFQMPNGGDGMMTFANDEWSGQITNPDGSFLTVDNYGVIHEDIPQDDTGDATNTSSNPTTMDIPSDEAMGTFIDMNIYDFIPLDLTSDGMLSNGVDPLHSADYGMML